MKPLFDKLETRLQSGWKRTDDLFALLKPKAFLAQPIVWRHPFIFYAGHLPAFAWNQICAPLLKRDSFNAYFDEIFCRGIDPDIDTGNCHPHPDVPEGWPDIAEIVAYRDNVRASVLETLDHVRSSKSNGLSKTGVFSIVLEHELMHQETQLYMVQELPLDLKRRPDGAARPSFANGAALEEIKIPAGRTTLGASPARVEFGWDNEFQEQTVDVRSFKMDSTPVTNEEFLAFVESGAYEDPRYWTKEDWAWKSKEGISHPNFWRQINGAWFYRAMFDLLPLDSVSAWPVYASLAEARAYARWKQKRLPTEAEYNRAAFGRPDGREDAFPWGEDEPASGSGNFDFSNWSPVAVGSNPKGASSWGIHELVGNGWEWTDTQFAPYPGFVPLDSYPQYSSDFFDGKHFVLKGASWATPKELLRKSFRNWYQAHYPYVFAKFRCVSKV